MEVSSQGEKNWRRSAPVNCAAKKKCFPAYVHVSRITVDQFKTAVFILFAFFVDIFVFAVS